MRLALWSLAAIVVIGVAAVLVAPLFISAEDVRNRVFAEIEGATGYRLTVNGPVHISAFRSLKLVAEDVGVAPSAGAGAVDLATAEQLRFGLALAPLLSGRVQVTEVALIKPVITMPEPASKTAAPTGDTGSGGPSIAAALQSLSLDSLLIEDGTVILRGEGGAPGKRIEALTVTASLPALAGPLSLDLKAKFDGKPLGVVGSIANFGPFLDGTPSQILLDVDAPVQFPKRLALMGTATYTGDMLALDAFSAKTGEAMVQGVVSANLSGAVPQIKASLSGDRLDLDALLGGGAKAPTASEASEGASGWSDAKIDFSGLKAVNVQLNLSVEQLSYGTIKAGPINIRAAVAGGKLKVELPNFQLYGGVGTGVLAVDATGKQAFRFSLSNLDAYPFLDAAAAFQRIEGKAAIAIDLTASGASQRAMVSALAGTASIEFTDGALRGINIAKMVRNLSSATLSGWQSGGDAEKTDFASLGASFKIAQGKAQTNDLHLNGPLVRMAGTGAIDLPARTLNFRVDPQVVASLEGQGGKTDLQGLGVPVAINGPWAAPSIYPDIAGILENPQAAYEKLSKLGGGLVKLPSADALGALGTTAGIGGLVKGKAGASIDDLLQADQGSGQQGVVQGLGQLLGGEQAVAPAAAPVESAAPPVEEPVKKKRKKKQAKASGTAAQPISAPPPAQAAPKQVTENLLGGF